VRQPVLTKADFYRRFLTGEFGNRGGIWSSFKELWDSGYGGLVMVRSQRPGGICEANLTTAEAWTINQKHGHRERLTFSAMCPHDRQTINGELHRDHRGLCLMYSHVKKPMRDSLREGGRQVFGLTAQHALRANVYAPDYEWLMELLELYPGHVIEFTAFEIFWGVLPRSKCSVWECRNY